MWHLWLIYHRNVVDVVHFCDTNWSSSPRWNSSLFIDDDIPVCCYRCSSWTSWLMFYCTLYVATNNIQLGSYICVWWPVLKLLAWSLTVSWTAVIFLLSTVLTVPFKCSSFCRNLYKVGNNYVSPMHTYEVDTMFSLA